MQSTIYVEMLPGVTVNELHSQLNAIYEVPRFCSVELFYIVPAELLDALAFQDLTIWGS